MPRYDHQRIEPKWQAYWDAHSTFETRDSLSSPTLDQGETQGRVAGEEKLYVLDMFPYPSGNGLHVGHPEGYTATDIVCRFSRMRGKNVLHPMGWDAFGLPAEQHAVKTGTHPRTTTEKNIGTFRRQLKMLGFSYDWSREFSTTDPDYFRWTQWIFLQIFDTWYDADFAWTDATGNKHTGKGRPIAELPIPQEVSSQGEEAVRRYRDKRRLAYQHEAPVNWCPELRTVLSNEEVNAEGLSERGQYPVTRIPLRQWMLRITAYADRLIDDLADLDWSDSVKALQRNWIGKSEGAEVDFYIGDSSLRTNLSSTFTDWKTSREQSGFPDEPDDDVLRVYTTRPDTLYGATYMVLAPEHPFVDRLTTVGQQAGVDAYRRKSALKSDLDRTDLAKEKTGVFTGSFAVNPANGEEIPIWIADYVLISYGTGAIMAVPGQDTRDWEFAEVFDLNIIRTVQPADDFAGKAYLADGPAINSDFLDGLNVAEAKSRMIEHLQQVGLGGKAANYRLRDWLFSRQHFWGEPFPIWHELDADGNRTGLLRTDAEADLPIELPENFEFKPHGRPEPPLDESPDEWLYKIADDGTKLKRETNSMPQWAGSCWYYLRFCDPKNSERFIDPEKEKQWLPVDLYIGGAEHAVLHLLYSRFWHKVLYDRGHVTGKEPFRKLVNQGMILGEPRFYISVEKDGDLKTIKPYRFISFDDEHQWNVTGEVSLEELGLEPETIDGKPHVTIDGKRYEVWSRAEKMSKSKGNVVNPDDVVEQYGADALRMYEMFMGPLEQMKPWNMSGVEGVSRFIGRVWRMLIDDRAEEVVLSTAVQDVAANDDQLRILHKTIKAVTGDIEKLSFNTAISRMMEFTNAITQYDIRPKSVLEPFVLLLSPFAPHVAEELWQTLGHAETLAYESWPEFDAEKIVEATIEIPVQINGKLRAKLTLPANADNATLQQAAESNANVQKQIAGQQVVKVIIVPGRMVNFVVKGLRIED